MRTEQEIQAGFQAAKSSRFEAHKDLMPVMESGCGRFPGALESLKQHGYARLPAAADRVRIGEIKEMMDRYIKEGRNIRSARNVAALGPDDDQTDAPRLDPSEFAKGESHYRNLVNYVDIQEPLVTCPPLVDIALDESLLSLAGAYLGCFPALAYIKMRRSYVNDLQDFDTNFFHHDGVVPHAVVDGVPVVKIFVYLNEVDEGGGPTTYVEGTNRGKAPNWRATVGDDWHKDRWTLEQMRDTYGKDRVVYFTGDVGDLYIADTNGMHRGTKPTARDRDIVILNYGVEEEDIESAAERPAIRQADYERLTRAQKAAADYLAVIAT